MDDAKRRMRSSAYAGKRRMGRSYLIKHLQGDKLTRAQAIKAKCYDCNGMGEMTTCDNISCSLQPFTQWVSST